MFLKIEHKILSTSLAFIAAILLLSTLYIDFQSGKIETFQSWLNTNYGWLTILLPNLFFIFLIGLYFSKSSSIRIGGDNASPEFSFVTWISMLFSAGLGIGLVYYGVAEPILHYSNPPPWDNESYQAVSNSNQAMIFTFLHWGLHGWVIYACMALMLAYFHFNLKKPLRMSSLLEGVLPKSRILFNVIDVFTLIAISFGIATSLGLGALQITSGIANYTTDIKPNLLLTLLVILFVTILGFVSTVSGLNKGIKILSQVNISLSLILWLFVLIAGPTIFILKGMLDNTLSYIRYLPEVSLWVQGEESNNWQIGWTIFYYSWWISWAPFVGMFIARISFGRTIKEFILAVVLIPTLMVILWFSVFGNAALFLETNYGEIAKIISDNPALSLFALLEGYPFYALTGLMSLFIIVIFFVTSSDSGAFIAATISSKNSPNKIKLPPSRTMRALWSWLFGMVAAILLYVGGLQALQISVVMAAFPIGLLMVLGLVNFMKKLN